MSRAPGSYAGLTVAQADLLSFLREQQDMGHTPSFEEMKDALGYFSKSNVHRLVRALEERGYVIRHPNRARSIVCSAYPKVAVEQMDTAVLIAELTNRGFRFYGLSAEAA